MSLDTAKVEKSGRGVPKRGFRLTTNRRLQIEEAKRNGVEIDFSAFTSDKKDFVTNLINIKNNQAIEHRNIIHEDSFEDIKLKVKQRFDILEEIAISVAMGISPALIISGAGGIGKSRIVKDVIESLGIDAKFVNGKVSPIGLFKLAYECREEGSVLIFDDSDSVFDDVDSINLLKQITDSCDDRRVSWHSNRTMVDMDGEDIPNDFDFYGSVIFISNIDFYKEAEANNKLAVHIGAMISRSFVLDVDMKNSDYFLARLEQILFEKMDESVYDMDTKNSIYSFMTVEKNSLRELSLRMVKKIHTLMQTYGKDWQAKSKILLCK